PLKVFMMDVVHDAQKIDSFVANMAVTNVSDAPSNTIDCFISEVFRNPAGACRENRNQPPADPFVDLASPIRIGIKPKEQAFKIFLLERLKSLCRRHSQRPFQNPSHALMMRATCQSCPHPC